MIQEIPRTALSGVLALIVLLLAIAVDVALFVVGIVQQSPLMVLGSVLLFVVLIFLFFGLFVVNPNEARVLQLFGRYVGTVSDQGFRWANPFYG